MTEWAKCESVCGKQSIRNRFLTSSAPGCMNFQEEKENCAFRPCSKGWHILALLLLSKGSGCTLTYITGWFKSWYQVHFFNYYAPSQPNRLKFYTRIPKTLAWPCTKPVWHSFDHHRKHLGKRKNPFFGNIFFGNLLKQVIKAGWTRIRWIPCPEWVFGGDLI